jgi:hypothetical protein
VPLPLTCCAVSRLRLPGVAEVIVVRFRAAAPVAVIVAEVQLEERSKGEAEPA